MPKEGNKRIENNAVVTDGPGKFDLERAIFDAKRVEVTVMLSDKKFCDCYDLHPGEYRFGMRVSSITRKDDKACENYVLCGMGEMLVGGGWGGHHTYFFSAVVCTKDRQGKAFLTRDGEQVEF